MCTRVAAILRSLPFDSHRCTHTLLYISRVRIAGIEREGERYNPPYRSAGTTSQWKLNRKHRGNCPLISEPPPPPGPRLYHKALLTTLPHATWLLWDFWGKGDVDSLLSISFNPWTIFPLDYVPCWNSVDSSIPFPFFWKMMAIWIVSQLWNNGSLLSFYLARRTLRQKKNYFLRRRNNFHFIKLKSYKGRIEFFSIFLLIFDPRHYKILRARNRNLIERSNKVGQKIFVEFFKIIPIFHERSPSLFFFVESSRVESFIRLRSDAVRRSKLADPLRTIT